ncbi:hypothetical protein [Paenibacillus harenae]|uniref:hypothetical protein n=1 Tax=Paenibacillus harenae TaxID=306543 RepID=UPI00040B50E6|nr:hypothetical protein [Paenibacillus harenae]
MGILAPALQIAGIAISSEFISRLMEENGHGGKVVFVKIISYIGCAYIAFNCWWDGVRYVAHTFGVSL